jgi:hypothetical protein
MILGRTILLLNNIEFHKSQIQFHSERVALRRPCERSVSYKIARASSPPEEHWLIKMTELIC